MALASSSKSAQKLPRKFSGTLSDLSDEDLVSGVCSGDQSHFNELYTRHFSRVYSFVHRRVRNHADSEEITQETFVAIFRSIDGFRGQSSLVSWIYGIARNLTNNAIRRAGNQREKFRSVAPAYFLPNSSSMDDSPEEFLSMQRYGDQLRQAFGQVAVWQRQIFEMRHLQNMSIAEIARQTDRSNDAVRSSLYRVKNVLIGALSEPGEDSVG